MLIFISRLKRFRLKGQLTDFVFSACPDHRESLQSKGSTVVSDWKDYCLGCVISNERKHVGLQLSIPLVHSRTQKLQCLFSS